MNLWGITFTIICVAPIILGATIEAIDEHKHNKMFHVKHSRGSK